MFWRERKRIDTTVYTKIIVVVGGSGYLGKAFIKSMRENQKVLFVVVSPYSTISGDNALSIRADLTKNRKETIMKILNLVGRIDVLIHAAATYSFEVAGKLSESSMKREFEVNTLLPLLVTQEVHQQYWSHFSKEENTNKGHKVIVIGSQAGDGRTKRDELITYSATKAALARAWEYFDTFLDTKGISSVFLKPGSLKEDNALTDFIKELTASVY